MSELNPEQTLLLFEVGDARMAVPLAQVDRLEEFRKNATEHSGDQNVVQYREKIMPLVDLCQILGKTSQAPSHRESFQVVVTSHDGRRVGLVVDKILDIVEDSVELDSLSKRRGLKGSALVQNRVTDFLDVDSILQDAGLTRAAA